MQVVPNLLPISKHPPGPPLRLRRMFRSMGMAKWKELAEERRYTIIAYFMSDIKTAMEDVGGLLPRAFGAHSDWEAP